MLIIFLLGGAAFGWIGFLFWLLGLIYKMNGKRKLKKAEELTVNTEKKRRCRRHPLKRLFKKKHAEGGDGKKKKLKDFLKAVKQGEIEPAEITKRDYPEIYSNQDEKLNTALYSLVVKGKTEEAEILISYLKKKDKKRLQKEKERRQASRLSQKLIRKCRRLKKLQNTKNNDLLQTSGANAENTQEITINKKALNGEGVNQ